MAWVWREFCIFFGLKKKHGNNKNFFFIHLTNDTCLKSSHVFKFYQKLYTSLFDPHATSLFFHKVQSVIPKINENNRELCEKHFTMYALYNIAKRMPNNKSPGPDCLPFELFKVFWDIGALLWSWWRYVLSPDLRRPIESVWFHTCFRHQCTLKAFP